MNEEEKKTLTESEELKEKNEFEETFNKIGS